MDFLNALFDFSFTEFVTGQLIKVLYALSIAVIALIYLGSVIAGFSQGAGTGLFILLIAGPILALFWAIVVRVVLELNMVLFRIYENTQRIASANGQPPASLSGASYAPGPFAPNAGPAANAATPFMTETTTPPTP